MRRWMRFAVGGLLLGLVAAPSHAEDPDAALDDVTMEVVDESDADEGEYVDEILLPGAASPEGRDPSAFGRGRADEARKNGRAFGETTAEEARRMGRDAGAAAGAGSAPGGPPDGVP